jgi:hypothetical protein
MTLRPLPLLGILFIVTLLPAIAGAATITGISLWTNGNAAPYGGIWGTNMSVASGTYLLLLGYEDRFFGTPPSVPAAAPGDISAVLTVYYSDGSSKTATFSNNSLGTASWWTRTFGDASLGLGSSGIAGVDRVGDSGWGSYASNGVDDVVLQFSDASVPEPATWGLVVGALGLGCLGWLLKRSRAI